MFTTAPVQNYQLSFSGGNEVTSAVQAEIVNERAWELAAEFTRWFDMVRTEAVEEAIALRDPSELPIINSPGTDQYIAPIPVFDITLNPNLVQNLEENVSSRFLCLWTELIIWTFT